MIIGLVGKPSAGKSTFFRASTLAEAEIANYPFTTIKPNHGVGFVRVDDPAKQFGKVSNPRMGFVFGDQRFVPIDMLDVAGLVPGAHEGLGMGNQFLDDLRQADAFIHVVDISGSTNEKGEPVAALTHDPAFDVGWLIKELDLWFLGIVKRGWERFSRQLVMEKQTLHKALGKQLSGLNVTEDMVKRSVATLKLPEDRCDLWTEEQLYSLAAELRRMTKPMIIACNKIDVPGAEKNFERLKEQFKGELLVGVSAEMELALREATRHGLIAYTPGDSTFKILKPESLNEKQKGALGAIQEFLNKHKTTGVQQVCNAAVFDLLKYIAVFPGGVNNLVDKNGNVLPDCFLVKEGSTALEFAFKLHTDLGRGFIRAIDVKTKRTVGKEHILKHGDIVEIVSNA